MSVAGRIVPDAHATKRNLFTLKATDEALGNLAKKGASDAVAKRLLEKAKASKEDTVLVGVDDPSPLSMAMGILRLEMGRELKLVDEKAYRFLWITHFPLFERASAGGRLQSVNHPFTAPLEEDVALLDSAPGRCEPTTSSSAAPGRWRQHPPRLGLRRRCSSCSRLPKARPLRLLHRGPPVRRRRTEGSPSASTAS
jgi:hypothetical protein